MKKFLFVLLAIVPLAMFAQGFKPTYEEKVVYEGSDVIFRQIDAHTWEGNGHLMANETLYLIEGEERAILLDAGTDIKELDKIVAGITSKPVTLIATHVHPDHTGKSIDCFPEIYINAADMVNVAEMMPNYKGTIKYLRDGETIDLGGRQIEVIFTPGHTPGSTTFIDRAAGYGFSGDAFGSGNLLLITNCSTLILTCQRMSAYMQKNGIKKLYPGHYMGKNVETVERVINLGEMAQGLLEGKYQGEPNPKGMLGLNRVLTMHGVRINYGEAQLK